MQPDQLLASAYRCVEQGDLSALIALIKPLDSPAIQDPSFHLGLADVCEKMGLLDLAVRECGLALRDAPALDTALRLSLRLSLEQGDLHHAERDVRLLLQEHPQEIALRLELGRILEITGRFKEALELYQATIPTENDTIPLQEAKRRAARYAQRGRSRPAVDDPLFREASDPIPSPEPESTAPSEADAISFAHLFSGREGVYARQWYSDTGKSGYTPVHQPFTPLVARSHLLGNYTIGIYPLRMNQSVLFMAFDVDIVQEALTKAAKEQQPHELPRLIRTAHAVARQLLDACAMFDIAAVLEDSGWKGRHLWIFFSEPVPAASARRLGQWLLHTVGPLPDVCRVELFPKQSRLDTKQLGNLIKLPLGIHRVTGRLCALLDANGSPLSQPIKHLRHLKKLSRQRLQELLVHADHIASLKQERRRHPNHQPREPISPNTSHDPTSSHTSDDPTLDSYAYTPAPPSTELTRSSTSPPPTPSPYRIGKDQEVEQVLRGCHVLRAIVGRALSSGILSTDDTHILIYTMGNLTQGDAAVNAVLSKVQNIDPRIKLKSPLRSYPTSCPKIRARLPELTASVPCHCAFPQHTSSYPHPLLHLAQPPQLPQAPTIPPYSPQSPTSHPYPPNHASPSQDRVQAANPPPPTAATMPSSGVTPPTWEILEKPLQTPSRFELESWTHRLQQAHQDLERAQQSIATIEHKIAQYLHVQGTREYKTRHGTLRVDSRQRIHLLQEPLSPPSTDPSSSHDDDPQGE